MTVFAGKNSSTLNALLSSNGKMCRSCCFTFASNDCCCFLDPATNAYDSAHSYSIDDLCEKSGLTWKSLQNGNLDHTPETSPTWWTQVSDIVSCGNVNWNSISPFGGPGKTPFLYKAVVTETFPADITAKRYVRPNGTYILSQESNFPCKWNGNNGNLWNVNEHSDCLGIKVKLFTRIGQWGNKTTFNMFMWGYDWNSQTLMLALGDVHQLNGEIIDDGLQYWPGNTRLYKRGTAGATVTITPISGIIRLWIVDKFYTIDKIVKNQYDNWFICILNHTATENDEPGIGVNWPTYWKEVGSTGSLISGGNLVWDIEPFTQCEFSDSLQMTVVVPDDVSGYEGEVWEYKFLICDDDYVLYDSNWQSSPSFTAEGLPECDLGVPWTARYGYITARARLKNFPKVVTCNAPRKTVIMAGAAYVYLDSVFWWSGQQDGNIDCGHIHVDNVILKGYFDPPHDTQPGGQIKVRARVGFQHWLYPTEPLYPTIWGNWYESDWLDETEFWETPEDCAGDPDYRFTRAEVKHKTRNACGDGTDAWDW